MMCFENKKNRRWLVGGTRERKEMKGHMSTMSILSRFVKPVKPSAEERAESIKYALSHYARDWREQIEVITPDEARELCRSGMYDGAYEPIGRYIVPQNDDALTAIDNSGGQAWVESFDHLGPALLWLLDESITANDARTTCDKISEGN